MASETEVRSIVFITAVFLVLVRHINGEYFVECEGVLDGTFMGSSKDCRKYIFCNGQESYDEFCMEGQYFNAQEEYCEDKEYVVCTNESEFVSTNYLTTEEMVTSAAMTTSTLSPSPSTSTKREATWTFQTHSSKASTNTMVPFSSGLTLPTEASVSRATTATGETKNSSSTPPSGTSTSSKCRFLNKLTHIAFLPDAKSCSAYYVCANGIPIEMTCSSMLHFNAKSGKCDYPKNVKCSLSHVDPKEQCRRHIVDFYPFLTNCNYYYRCNDGFLMLEQCPLSYGWDIEKRTCVALNKAMCK